VETILLIILLLETVCALVKVNIQGEKVVLRIWSRMHWVS